MRPGLRSQVIRPRRHPRIEPSSSAMDSHEMCMAALFACARLFNGAIRDGTRRRLAETRHEAARQLLLARAAAAPWVVPQPGAERFLEMTESLEGLEGESACEQLIRFPAAFLALLERRRSPATGRLQPRRRRDDGLDYVRQQILVAGPASSES